LTSFAVKALTPALGHFLLRYGLYIACLREENLLKQSKFFSLFQLGETDEI
jgi:hypothetical protein